jgi:hypothetical protein
MRSALLLVSLLAGVAAAPAATPVAANDPEARASPAWQPRLLAQRQPGGLPGRSDMEEEGRPGGKPGGLPERAQPPGAPATRSLQTPKARGPEPANGSDKKAPRGPKQAPDKSN